MKSLLLCALIAMSFTSFAQTEPVKGNSKIIITTSLSPKEAYKSTLKKLISEGYFVDLQDSVNFYIKTQPVPIKKSSLVGYYNLVFPDGQIVISGMGKAGYNITLWGVTTIADYYPITYGGMKNSPMRRSFEFLQELASKFSETITYK